MYKFEKTRSETSYIVDRYDKPNSGTLVKVNFIYASTIFQICRLFDKCGSYVKNFTGIN